MGVPGGAPPGCRGSRGRGRANHRPRGFAPTPQGALAAAATLHPLAYYQWPQAAWTEFADTRVQWAPGQREQLAEALVPVWAAGVPDPMRVTPVGYRVIVYSPDRARFRLWWDVDFPDGRSATVGALVDVVWAARRLAAVLRRAGDGHARVAAHRHLPGLGPAMTPLLASALDLCGIPGLGAGACAAADALTSPEAVVGGLVAGPAGVIGGAASAMGLTMLGQIADSFFNAWWLFQAKALTFWTDTPTPGPARPAGPGGGPAVGGVAGPVRADHLDPARRGAHHPHSGRPQPGRRRAGRGGDHPHLGPGGHGGRGPGGRRRRDRLRPARRGPG